MDSNEFFCRIFTSWVTWHSGFISREDIVTDQKFRYFYFFYQGIYIFELLNFSYVIIVRFHKIYDINSRIIFLNLLNDDKDSKLK